jgi:hypothetical protein
LLRNDVSVSVPFPSACAVETIACLAENFEMRFSDFLCHATNICVFENPPPLAVSDAPEELQLKLIGLQHDSVLNSSFNQEASILFHASLPIPRFCDVRKESMKVDKCVYAFGSTCTCEQASSRMKQIELMFENYRCGLR